MPLIDVKQGKVRGKVASFSKNDALIEIEETQAALRESIRKARELSEQSDRLLSRGRGDPEAPPEPRPQPQPS
jgi:hypothetical protein